MSGASSTMASDEHRDLPPRGPVGRLHDVLLGRVPVEARRGGRSGSARPAGGRCRRRTTADRRSTPTRAGGSRARSRLRSDPIPLRRATQASQAMTAKFCEQMSTTSVVGSLGWSGSTTNAAATTETDEADAERGDGVADAPADPAPVAGAAGGRWRRRRAAGEAEAAAEGRCSQRRHPSCRLRNRSHTRGVAHPKSTVAPATDFPLRRMRRGAVAWSDRRRGAGRGMSRRQTDLEPGIEPDAGEPEPFGAPNGRPPTPPPVVASRHASADRAARAGPGDGPPGERPPTERRPRPPAAAARRRCAGCRGSCSR